MRSPFSRIIVNLHRNCAEVVVLRLLRPSPRPAILKMEVLIIRPFARISAARLNEFSAAAGVIPPCMTSIQPWLQKCSAWTCA